MDTWNISDIFRDGAGDMRRFLFAMFNLVDLADLCLISFKTPRACYKHYNLYQKCVDSDGVREPLCGVYRSSLVELCGADWDGRSLKVSDDILENSQKIEYEVSDDMLNDHKILLERVRDSHMEAMRRSLKHVKHIDRRHSSWCTNLSSRLFEEEPESPVYDKLKLWWDEECKKPKN